MYTRMQELPREQNALAATCTLPAFLQATERLTAAGVNVLHTRDISKMQREEEQLTKRRPYKCVPATASAAERASCLLRKSTKAKPLQEQTHIRHADCHGLNGQLQCPAVRAW